MTGAFIQRTMLLGNIKQYNLVHPAPLVNPANILPIVEDQKMSKFKNVLKGLLEGKNQALDFAQYQVQRDG